MKKEKITIDSSAKQLPWWTWIVPVIVCHLGTQMALNFEVAPGTAIWYPPIALSIVMANWWGLRVLPGLYLNAMFSAGLWGLPQERFWPLYALPETLTVFLSWLLFTRLAKGKCWLPNMKETSWFVLLGILIPVTIGNFYLHAQFTLLGDLPGTQFWEFLLNNWISDILSGLTLAVPLLIFLTPLMERRGLSLTQGAAKTTWPFSEYAVGRKVLEVGGFFGALFVLSLLAPLDGYWFAYGLIVLFIALRFGVELAVLASIWTIFWVLLLPAIIPGRFGATWTPETQLTLVHLDLSVLCLAGLLTGRTINDLLTEIKQRRTAEKALLTSEGRLRRLIENAPVPMLVSTTQNEVARVNAKFTELFGYTLEDVPTLEHWDRLAYPDQTHREQVVARWKQAIADTGDLKQGIKPQEETVICKDGSTRIVMFDFIKIGDRNLLTGYDITERKRVEQALQESERKFRDIAKNIPGMVYQFRVSGDGSTYFSYASPRGSELFGLPDNFSEVEDWDISTPVHPEDRQDFLISIAQAIQDATDWKHEGRMVMPDGSVKWVEGRSSPTRIGDELVFDGILLDITARKQAEAALRQSETQYRALFNNANDAIFMMQEDRFVNCNPKTLEVFGCSREQIIGQPPYRFSPEFQPDGRDSREKALEKIQLALQGTPQRFDWRHIRYDDTPFEAEVSLNRLELSGEMFLQAVVRDITKRKRAEESLREEKEKFQVMVEEAPLGVSIIRADGHYEYINPKFVELFGYTLEDIPTGRAWFARAFPDQAYREQVFSIWIADLKESQRGEARPRTFTVTCRDGSQKEIHFRPVTMGTGDQFVIYEDITQRKQAEETLREREEMIRALVETSQDWIWSIDLQGIHTYCNPAIETILGYRVEELVGKQSLDLIHNEDRIGIEASLQKWVREKRGWNNQLIRWRHKNGSYRYLESNAVPILNAENELIGFRGVDRDTTERKQAEESLQRYAERLRVLHQIDQAILAAQSPEEIAQVAVAHLQQLIPCGRIGVVLLDFVAGELVFLAVARDADKAIKEEGARISLEPFTDVAEQLRQGRIFAWEDLLSRGEVGESIYATGIQSYISVPLMVRGELIGALNFGMTEPRVFSPEQEELARQVAAQLAIAIQQARLFEAEAQRRQEAETLRRATAALTSALDLDQVLENILTHLAEVVPYHSACVFLQQGERLKAVAVRGFLTPEQVLNQYFPEKDDSLSVEIRRTGRPLILVDAPADPRFRQWGDSAHVRGWMGVPLMVGGNGIGHLTLDSREVDAFSEAEATLAQAFANQAAVAIENARLYTETEQRAEHLAVLRELDQAITASLRIDDVYQAFARHTGRLLPYSHMSIALLEGNKARLAYATGQETIESVGTALPLETLGAINWVVTQGQPLLSPDISTDKRFVAYRQSLKAGLHSAMIIPLRVKGQMIGTWNLVHRQTEGYTTYDFTVAQSMADQLAIAIENAHLYRQIQRHSEELEQLVVDRTRELSVLYEVTAIASESLDLQAVLTRALKRVLAAIKCNAGAIHLLNEGNGTLGNGALANGTPGHRTLSDKKLTLAVQQGLPPNLVPQIDSVPTNIGIGKRIIERSEPLVVPDVASDPYMSGLATTNSPQAYIGLPMQAGGQLMGILSILREATHPEFNLEEIALLTSIADQIGVIVESAWLRQRANRAAVIEERSRLARDLHDSVTQSLYSATLLADAGEQLAQAGDIEQATGYMIRLGEVVQHALKEMRLLIYELRPSALDQVGLVEALRQRLESVEKRANIQIGLTVDEPVDLPATVEQELYQIAQEALNNALKHAQATSVTVHIATADNRATLTVQDNGQGFDLESAKQSGGLGLNTMRERAEKIGGKLEVITSPGTGTQVKIAVNWRS